MTAITQKNITTLAAVYALVAIPIGFFDSAASPKGSTRRKVDITIGVTGILALAFVGYKAFYK